MLSSELAKIIQVKYSISNEAARKIISRSISPVHKLKSLSFEKNQKFIYLQEQYNSQKYFEKLYSAFKSSSKNHYQILLAIQNNGGFISKGVLASYVAAPVENLKRHKRYDLLIKQLVDLKFVNEDIDGYYQLLHPFNEKFDIKYSKAIELAKKTVVLDFCDWAKNINLIAYKSSKGFFQYANFAKFQWAFTSPSYINDVANRKNNKPGFWVGDIVIGRKADIEDIQFFIDKIDIIKYFKNVQNFIPVFISDNFSKDAYELLKKKGIVCGHISNLFNSSYADALRELVSIVKNSAAVINNDPEKFVNYMKKISLLEGKMGNLIGDLFEASVGYYFHIIGSKYFELNKIVEYDNRKKEIDVYVERDGKVKVVECKGIKNTIDHEYVETWLSDNIPIIYKAIKEVHPDAFIEFELWSTGGYLDETYELLKKAKANTKKYSIDYFNATQIRDKAKESKCDILFDSIESILKKEI
jgi:hypothetical protein